MPLPDPYRAAAAWNDLMRFLPFAAATCCMDGARPEAEASAA